jgi:tRNA-2-methylthio-N6-dimethylallyladenosine synthase
MGGLNSLRPLKDKRPDLVINLMGCLVGVKTTTKLKKRFPYVDVFSPPSDPGPLVAFLTQVKCARWKRPSPAALRMMDGDLVLPVEERGSLVSGFIPVVLRLLACLHLLHHPLPPRASSAAARGKRSWQKRARWCPGRQRDHPAGADRRPLRQRSSRYPNLAGLLARLHAIEGWSASAS